MRASVCLKRLGWKPGAHTDFILVARCVCFALKVGSSRILIHMYRTSCSDVPGSLGSTCVIGHGDGRARGKENVEMAGVIGHASDCVCVRVTEASG